jgi:hypothetical protein
MKKNALALFAFALLLVAPCFAQDAMPTKEETVNCINKKLQEVVGKEEGREDFITRYTAFSFRLNGDKVEFESSRKWVQKGQVTTELKSLYVFDPAHLMDGDAAVYECGPESGDHICLKFPEKLVKETTWINSRESRSETDRFSVPVNLKIPEFKSRFIKAVTP